MQKAFSYIIIFLACLVQTLAYWQNRSLFFDEINLSRNIVEKPYSQLFSYLDYDQHAPPLFSQTVKFCVEVFGVNEYALRLFPFLVGIASVFLFYRVAKNWLDKPALWFALMLFGFSIYLLEYNTEVKQYSTDVFMTCFFLFLTTKIKFIARKDALLIGCIGGLGLWFSMPSVFILVGLGFYYIFNVYASRKGLKIKDYLPVVGMIIIWLISFGILFYVNLKPSISSSHLQDFHAQFFLEFPISRQNIQQSINVLVGIIRSLVGKTAIPIAFAILCFFIGIFSLLKNNMPRLILVLIPIFVCSLVSMLHYYSLIIRLTLFLFPILILIISLGFSKLYKQSSSFSGLKKTISLSILALGCFLCLAGRSSLAHLFFPFQKENSRLVLKQLSTSSHQNIPLYITNYGEASHRFYTELYANPIASHFEPKIYGQWSDNLLKLAKDWKSKKTEYIWIYDGHTHGEDLINLKKKISQIGEIKEEYNGLDAFAILIKLK